MNPTSHLAVIADETGKLHNCYVKLLRKDRCALLCEAIGWLLATSSGIPCAAFAAIVMVPIADYVKTYPLPTGYVNEIDWPAWCCEAVQGSAPLLPGAKDFFNRRRQCLYSKDARVIASFDIWTDLQDRNFGNVIRKPNGGYIAIDHESILHSLL
ncbi:MAG: hypothetical protein NT123_01810, partial [Proteobacteria bacterium]|nr:hypothetical protein [Pseudomonadota bacterium]